MLVISHDLPVVVDGMPVPFGGLLIIQHNCLVNNGAFFLLWLFALNTEGE